MMNTEAEVTTVAIGLYERGFVRAAVGTLERAANQFPNSARIWEMQGILLQSERDFAGAQFALESASLLSPLSIAGEFALAACYIISGHLKSASAIYEHLLKEKLIPTSRLAELAAGLSRCGQYHLALSACRQGAERDPESDEAIYGMAHYMGRLCYPAEQIIPLLHKAISLAPHVSQYRVTLAGWFSRIGCYRNAHEQLQSLDEKHFESIRCACCLQRLIQVSQEVQDEEMTNLLNACLEHATKPSC